MDYIEAPAEWDGIGTAIFLAGGITDCPTWQDDARAMLRNTAVVLNPRRVDFPSDDPTAKAAQVAWEFRHIARATLVLFWFPASDSPQPITLYELGRCGALDTNMVVGCERGYARRSDVREQMKHARPDLHVYSSLAVTCRAAQLLARC